MLGLNKADASNEYSWRKYAPIRRRCVLFNSACGSNASSISCGARLENIEQISVTAFEIFEHVAQLLRGSFGIEPKNPVDDMIGPDLIGRIEVSGLSRRLEGSDDDPGRIRAQIQGLAIQELGLGQRGSLGLFEAGSCDVPWPPISWDGGSRFGRSRSVRLNWRISTRPRRYDSTDSAPLFSLAPIRMEPIRTAARFGIDQRCLQVVFAQKPIECAHRPCRPLRAVVRPPRGKARGNRRRRLDGLLIERFGLLAEPAEALGPDRPEVSR